MSAAAVASPGKMTVEEYLRTSFEGPDLEYLDGELVERNMGNLSHGLAQGRFIVRFGNEEARTGLVVVPELRHRVTASRYRIPDVAVFRAMPQAQVPPEPPLVAIEILSPDDRWGYVMPKLNEYLAWGVQNIWIADPESRKFFVYDRAGLREVPHFELPEFGIVIEAEQIFS